MSRITAPSRQIARQINSAARPASSSSLLEHNAGATLMPKYAELLRGRRSQEHSDSARGMTTTHRPTPQPSIRNRSKPLMQTFSSSAAVRTPSTNIDATVLPSFASLQSSSPSYDQLVVPILPDNHAPRSIRIEHDDAASSSPVSEPAVTIVAANPENVLPGGPLTEVEGVGLDSVDVKFAHEGAAAPKGDEHQGGMLRDMWKGMVDEVFGQAPKKA